MNGNFSTALQSGTRQFYGNYSAINPPTGNQAFWEMEIFLDFNNIANSYALDTNTCNEVEIHFSSYNNNVITGSISDPKWRFQFGKFFIF